MAAGRLRFYGVSCAFYPLRDLDPEKLDLARVAAGHSRTRGHDLKLKIVISQEFLMKLRESS